MVLYFPLVEFEEFNKDQFTNRRPLSFLGESLDAKGARCPFQSPSAGILEP